MPKPTTGKAYEKKYTEKDLLAAVTAINDGMPKREAARKYGIPRATLQFRLSSDLIKTRPGPSTVLSGTEEGKLADWIITSSKKGFPRRKEDVLHSVEQFMIKTPRASKFKDNKPGEGWYKLFLKRHPEIAHRTAEAVTSASANVSEDNIKNWFKQIENTLTDEERKILDDPSRIFNGDETGFQLCPKQGKVLAEKGSRDVYEIDSAAAKSSITVMFTFSASGRVTPPLIIYPLKRMREDIRRSVPSDWGISLSDNGWMTKEIFFQYVTNILYPHLVSKDVTFPVILFVDGHKSHINYELSEKCKELGIVLVALYPNATRILQPADVAAFKPIKNEWRKTLLEWRRDNVSKQLTKVDFGRVLTTVVANINKEGIINGFRACGLYPWNPNAINYTKCLGKQKKTDPAPCHDKKMTMIDFQSLVGSDVLFALQNEALFEDNIFYKALENIYKFLRDETISVDVPDNNQRRICIDDEWLPIDDLPLLIVPGAGENVEEFSMEIHGADLTNQNERCGQKVITEREHDIEKRNMKTPTNQKNHRVSADNPEDSEKKENATKMKKEMTDDSKNRHVETLKKDVIKEDNNIHTENLKITGDDLDIATIETNPTNKEKREDLKGHKLSAEKVEDIEKIANETEMKEVLIDSLEKILSENITTEIIIEDNHTQLEHPEMNSYDLDNICIETVETENNKKIQENLKKLQNICEELDSTDSHNKPKSPAKIDDFLYKAPTPKRKGKILSKNSSIYVLTSDKWLESEKNKQDEKEKAIAEKLERKRNRELVKQAKLLRKEETQNKKNKKRKCTDEMEMQDEVCKKRKTCIKKIKDNDNVTNETEKFSNPNVAKITETTYTDKIHVYENELKIDDQKNNKRQKRLKSDAAQSKCAHETDTTLKRKVTAETQHKGKNETETTTTIKETEITKMNVVKDKTFIKEKTETLIKTKIQAEVCENPKTDVNKNNEKKNQNETEQDPSKNANIKATDKINANEYKIVIDQKENNKRQSRLKHKYETESTATSEMIDETQFKRRNETETRLTKKSDITKINIIKKKTINEKIETLKPVNKISGVNILSVIPFSVNPTDNVKRRLFDYSCNVKPSEFVLKPPQILKRRSTFRNEKELQDYVNNECGDCDSQ